MDEEKEIEFAHADLYEVSPITEITLMYLNMHSTEI